jgi:iron(III) transport system substrate-binding protein
MRIRSRTGLWLLPCLAAVLVAAGCGGDNSKSSSGATTAPSAAATAAAPATTAASSAATGASPATSAASTGTTLSAAAWDTIVANAKKEGTITLYTVAQQATLDMLQPAFEKAYPGIKMSIFRGNTGQVITKLTTEQQANTPGADVVVVNQDAQPSTLTTYDQQGKLATPQGPSFSEADFKAAVQGNHFWVYAVPFGWAWNTQLLPGGIHSWNDFLDPKLGNGKIAVFDPSQSSLTVSCYKNQIAASGDPQYLTKLAAQKPKIYPGGQAQENAVASGEVATTGWASTRVNSLKAQGAPVQFAIPPNGQCVPGVEGGIIKNAAHPNAAQVFANWLASAEAQTIILASGTPARSNVPGNTIDFKSLTPTPPASAADQQAFVAQFNSMFH